MYVTKRDGTKQPYSIQRIRDAISKAAIAAGENSNSASDIAITISNKVEQHITEFTVDEIQNLVENKLLNSKYKHVGKSYIEYRHERDLVRQSNSDLYHALNGFLEATDDTYTKENSNKDSAQISTHRDLIAGIVSKNYAKTILPKDIYDAHSRGRIHIHDTDYIITSGIHNCGVYDFDTMLANGVKLGDVDVETPKSIGTAANIICQILAKISGCSYGGQSIHEFDNVMRPYAIKTLEKLKAKQEKYGLSDEFVNDSLRKEIYDACQLVIYQVQTVSSPNGQASFFAMSLSLSTDPICKMIKEEYLRCHMNGIGPDHKTPIFPKVLYFVEDGVNMNPCDPNYDEFKLALECSSKRMYPDYIMAPNNRKMTGGSKNVITSMGCRSYLHKYMENGKEKVTGRFNVGVTSINLPLAALRAGGNKERFVKELDDAIELAYSANMFRVDRLKGTKAKVSPILWQYGALASLEAEDTIDHLFYGGNATCSIGYVGLSEAAEIIGDVSKEYTLGLMKLMKAKCAELTERSDIAFSMYGTPAESLTLKFANSIRENFPDYEYKLNYITNSFHLPVHTDVGLLDKLEYESDFFLYSSGGNVNTVEVPNLSKNLKALEGVIKAAYDKVNYLIINQPVDQCFKCGFHGEFDAGIGGYSCPFCGNSDPETANCIRRVSGYVHDALARPANKGKFSEQVARKKNL